MSVMSKMISLISISPYDFCMGFWWMFSVFDFFVKVVWCAYTEGCCFSSLFFSRPDKYISRLYLNIWSSSMVLRVLFSELVFILNCCCSTSIRTLEFLWWMKNLKTHDFISLCLRIVWVSVCVCVLSWFLLFPSIALFILPGVWCSSCSLFSSWSNVCLQGIYPYFAQLYFAVAVYLPSDALPLGIPHFWSWTWPGDVLHFILRRLLLLPSHVFSEIKNKRRGVQSFPSVHCTRWEKNRVFPLTVYHWRRRRVYQLYHARVLRRVWYPPSCNCCIYPWGKWGERTRQ